MDFSLSEEHLLIRQAARDFAQNELKEGVIERDIHMTHPTEQVKMLGEMGFMGMMINEKYGGSGMDTLSYAIAIEELSKVDNSCSVIMSAHNSLVCWGVEAYGEESVKENFLTKLATGELIGGFCLSEPEAGREGCGESSI